jgi:hypothetical protein
MRTFVSAVAGITAIACASKDAKVDTAVSRDSSVVAGPAVVPSAQPPAETTKGPAGKPGTARNVPAPPAAGPATAEARNDSVRGIVSVVGTSFDKHVMIAERGTQRRIEITGALSALIGHVAGGDLAVSGSISGTKLDASRFVVRSVDSQPAIDGTLRSENGSLYIVTLDGTRTRIVAPPPPLVGHEGARVWITGDPAKGVSSFGFIDPPR